MTQARSTTTPQSGGRRWFLRSVTGAALGVVAAGAQALFGTSAASAGEADSRQCCLLVGTETVWCALLCSEIDYNLRCWSCNNNQCKCCECTVGDSCFVTRAVCAHKLGCCLT